MPIHHAGETPTQPDLRPVFVYLAAEPIAGTIAQAIYTAGARAVAVTTPSELVGAVDQWFPVLALLDCDAPDVGRPDPAQTSGRSRAIDDWQGAVRRCKLRPHTRRVPLVVFGDLFADSPPVAGQAHREEATQLGVDGIYTRQTLADHLPTLIDQAIDPPTVYPQGWDEPLSAKAQRGIEEFNRREFYEQHEWLEHAWMDETRPIREFYQGVLQVGVAFYQIEQGNWAGALKMFRRGLPLLRALPPICQGIDLARLRTQAEQIHREITALGPERLAEFDTTRFPHIRLVEPH